MDGSCHCGEATWRLGSTPGSATACNCSICRRYGALWAYGFFDEEIEVFGRTQVYIWHRKSIEFHFCRRCACIVFWRAAELGPDERRFGAVNLRLSNDPTLVQGIQIVHHDTESNDDLPLDGMRVADVWA